MAHHLNELTQLAKSAGETLLLAAIIPDSFKHTLRESKQNYLDLAGNCYIHSGGMLLLVQGRKLSLNPEAVKQPFGKSGLRVLFILLTEPDAINYNVRELANQAGVSVGTAQLTVSYLRKSRYLVAIDANRRKLTRLDQLREQWVSRYATTLKPSLSMGCFRLPKHITPADWRELTLQPGTYWGGEAAADALTDNLRPGALTLYTTEQPVSLLQKYRLLPDANGLVEVNKVFWPITADTPGEPPTVSPLLVYADLMATADPRTTETARRIYQQYVQNNV